MNNVAPDCNSLTSKERVRAWDESVSRIGPYDVSTRSLGEMPLEAAMEVHRVGDIAIALIKGKALDVNARPRSTAKSLSVMIPLTPGGWIEGEECQDSMSPRVAYLLNPDLSQSLHLPFEFAHWGLILADSVAAPARRFLRDHAYRSIPLWGVGALMLDLLGATFLRAPHLTPNSAATAACSIVDLFNAMLLETDPYADRAETKLEAFHRRRIRDYALLRLREPDLSVKLIAAAVGLSSRHVTHLFSTEDLPLMHWVWSERLSRVRRDLAIAVRRGNGLREVAFAWGFSDQAHFSRSFKLKYGMTPTAYVRQALVAAEQSSVFALPSNLVDSRGNV